MKYAFIHTRWKRFQVGRLCRCLDVSKSGYYRWLKNPLGKRGAEDQFLKQRIFAGFGKSKCIYGSPRIHAQLKRDGVNCSRKRVARLMGEMKLRSVIKRKLKATTNSRHNKPVSKKLLERKFQPSGLNQVWAGDITYVPTGEGWLYLVVVMDLRSRKIIGWSMSSRIKTELVEKALEAALSKRSSRSRGSICFRALPKPASTQRTHWFYES